MVLAPSVAGLFKWRQFEPEMILLAVGWYLRFSLSYRRWLAAISLKIIDECDQGLLVGFLIAKICVTGALKGEWNTFSFKEYRYYLEFSTRDLAR